MAVHNRLQSVVFRAGNFVDENRKHLDNLPEPANVLSPHLNADF